jgi:hypothetical protein
VSLIGFAVPVAGRGGQPAATASVGLEVHITVQGQGLEQGDGEGGREGEGDGQVGSEPLRAAAGGRGPAAVGAQPRGLEPGGTVMPWE